MAGTGTASTGSRSRSPSADGVRSLATARAAAACGRGVWHRTRRAGTWLAVGIAVALPGPVATAIAAGIKLPEGPGADLVYARCQTCHDLQYVVDAKGLLPAQWKSTLASMRDYGLTISAADEAAILTYLDAYLGPNPPPTAPGPAAAAGTGTAPPRAVDGRQVFETNCSSCHGPAGAGLAGAYPPLAGNADLAAEPTLPARVALFGMTGEIEVNGQPYKGTMPSFGHLGDAEIAAVANYVRSAWGGAAGGSELDAAAVAKLRAKAMTADEVHAWRAGRGLR